MSKFPTFPTLFDSALQIKISKLKEWGYLKPNRLLNTTLNWSRNGNPTGSISICVCTYKDDCYIELDYKYRDEPRKYKVRLVSTSSNIGKGKLWFFLCPHTKKRCRILYSIDGYFLHREAFKGCMYESQTRSKEYRQIEKTYGVYFEADRNYGQLYKKHFKKFYAGKPTKKYLKLMEQIQRADRIPLEEIERLYLR